MRLIIGIIIGVLIVFNWATIRDVFDSSLAGASGGKSEAPEESVPPTVDSPATAAPASPTPPVQPSSLSDMVEQQLKNASERQ